MSKYVVEYKLHGGKKPYFIGDGGYFPYQGSLIGLTKDSSECHIPKLSTDDGYLVERTKSDLIQRWQDFTGQNESEATTEINAWWNAKGLA